MVTDPDQAAVDPTLLGQDEFRLRWPHQGLSAQELAVRYGRDGRRPSDTMALTEIHARLEAMVFMVLTMRRSVRPSADALTWFPRTRVEYLFAQIALVTRTSVELAYHVFIYAPEILLHLADDDLHEWVLRLLEVYDRSGTQGCIRFLQQVADHALELQSKRYAQPFAAVVNVLALFVTALAGRRLRLEVADRIYTDTETLFLPPFLAVFPTRQQNFLLYKAIVAHLWAQSWFGTWRTPVAEFLLPYPDKSRALRLFHALERLRLDACLARELPGLWRDIAQLVREETALTGAWRTVARRLKQPAAEAADSWRLLERLYAQGAEPPPPACYQGGLDPERVAVLMAARAAQEKRAFQGSLALIADELGGNLTAVASDAQGFSLEPHPDENWAGGLAYQLVLGDQPVVPSADLQRLMHSVVQDLGHIPAEYLEPAGHGRYQRKPGPARDGTELPATCESYVYDEWDYTRKGYRKGWCQLRERDVHPQFDDFVGRTRHKYRGLLKHLYRTFEALRGEDRLVKREPFGEDLDIDAIVNAYADSVRGLEMNGRLFQRRQRLERNIAVLFMVDMSGSTKGWINEVERESLVLLCESLELLGDRYAIYGFSGFTHMRCELFRVKNFDDSYDDQVRARIAGIRPQDYTRMGVVIRHLTRKLLAVEARTRVLITLSDGRPDDEDGYRGDYGIEDTRQAVLEARNQGVSPFCITIDDEAQDYLPHMFGAANYILVDNVAKLPYRVSDIYRRITA